MVGGALSAADDFFSGKSDGNFNVFDDTKTSETLWQYKPEYGVNGQQLLAALMGNKYI